MLTLLELVNCIYSADIPRSEQRLLAKSAIGCALHSPSQAQAHLERDKHTRDQFEDALEAVGEIVGLPQKPSVTEATAYLRDVHGINGMRLASRLGKLSKSRNLASHPVGDFAQEMTALSGRGPVPPFGDNASTAPSRAEVSDQSVDRVIAKGGLKLDKATRRQSDAHVELNAARQEELGRLIKNQLAVTAALDRVTTTLQETLDRLHKTLLANGDAVPAAVSAGDEVQGLFARYPCGCLKGELATYKGMSSADVDKDIVDFFRRAMFI